MMKKVIKIIFLFVCVHNIAISKIAMITGINGQDGAYLAEFLLEKGYIVHGIKRRTSTINTQRIDPLYYDDRYRNKFFLHYGDMTDALNLLNLIESIQPDEIYNLAAQSHVKVSFEVPLYTADVDALGTLRILEIIRYFKNKGKEIKFYQASTSEMFGLVQEIPQKETTPFYPRSPYAAAKLYAHWITKNYREAYDIFACSGILFNHESPWRGETFVTRKITRAAVKIAQGEQDILYLGNLNAYRDWGHARDYVEAMWLMLQQDKADDFVIATGNTHSVREFVELAFAHVGMDIGWQGSGINEIGYDKKTGKKLICIDQKYFRPSEVDFLIGDASKARNILGWTPKITFEELVAEMMLHELTNVENNNRNF